MEEIELNIEKRREEIERECNSAKIDLTALGLDDLDALTVAISIFKRDEPIISLHLGSNSFGDEGMEAIANSLPKHPELEHVYVGSNQFREAGISALSNALSDLTNLQTLSVGGAQIDDAQCTNLASALMAMETSALKYLYLNSNCIGDDGLLSLIVALSSGKFAIETLHLGDNDFSSNGIKILADFLENDLSIVKLFLNDNDLEDEGISFIGEALCVNRTLKFLSLANCGINNDAMKTLLPSLSVNEHLDSLHLWKNLVTEESGELLLEVLRKHNHVLTDIQIFDNPFENYELFLDELRELLLKNARGAAEIKSDDSN